MSSNINELFKQADNHIDNGQLNAAQSVLKQIIDIDPENHEAYMQLGSIDGELGNINDSINNLKKSISLNNEFADAHFILGHIYSAMKNITDARSSFTKAVDLEPDDWEYASTLANFHFDNKDYSQAAEFFSKAFNLKSDDIDSLYKLATSHHAARNLDAACENYTKLLSFNACNQAALKPLISLFIEQEKIGDAEKYIAKALNECKTTDPDIHYYNSVTQLKNVNNIGALEAIDQAITSNQNNNLYVIQKAVILESLGKFDEALEILTPLLESSDMPYQAALVFAKISPTFEMKEDAISILKALLDKNKIPEGSQQDVNKIIHWLENQ